MLTARTPCSCCRHRSGCPQQPQGRTCPHTSICALGLFWDLGMTTEAAPAMAHPRARPVPGAGLCLHPWVRFRLLEPHGRLLGPVSPAGTGSGLALFPLVGLVVAQALGWQFLGDFVWHFHWRLLLGQERGAGCRQGGGWSWWQLQALLGQISLCGGSRGGQLCWPTVVVLCLPQSGGAPCLLSAR